MKSEAVVQSEIRAEAGRLGILLWRNNRGACTDETGRIIRYGLGNDSPQVDKRLKSSDLIGIYTRFDRNCVDKDGVFLAVECKAEGWTFPVSMIACGSPDEFERRCGEHMSADMARTLAQWRYLRLVHDAGGLAGFAQSVDDFIRILQGELVLP